MIASQNREKVKTITLRPLRHISLLLQPLTLQKMAENSDNEISLKFLSRISYTKDIISIEIPHYTKVMLLHKR